jgi:hypothetical protein
MTEKKRTTEDRIVELESAVNQLADGFNKLAEDVSHDLTNLAGGLHRTYSVSVASQILAESCARYMAGYKAGDFTKEFDNAVEHDELETLKMTAHGDFDLERFLTLAKETAQIFVKIRELEIKKRKDAQAKAESKIIQLEQPKIIIP